MNVLLSIIGYTLIFGMIVLISVSLSDIWQKHLTKRQIIQEHYRQVELLKAKEAKK